MIMYTILVNSDDSMVASVREPIYHRSSMMQKLRFLTDQYWTKNDESLDLTDFMCTLEYKTPASKRYIPVMLTPSESLYKNKLEYVVNIDTMITAEVGNVELKLTWTKLESNDDGTFVERCRLTPTTTIEVLPVAQWSDYVADSDLSNIAQIMLTNQAVMEQMKIYAEQLEKMGKEFTTTKADNIGYNKKENSVQLQANGNPIGNKIKLPTCTCDGTGSGGSSSGGYDSDGIPTVDFDPEPILATQNNDDGTFDTVLF